MQGADMNMKEQMSANRNNITIAVAIVLCAIVLAYNNGWFSHSTAAPEPVSSKGSASQTIDHENMKQDADKVTLKTTKPAGQTTE
jgi:uncharacterized protein (UPF0333 family)